MAHPPFLTPQLLFPRFKVLDAYRLQAWWAVELLHSDTSQH
jgi:hypothetical protein